MTSQPPPSELATKGRGPLSFIGIFFILSGIFAVAYPLAASIAIEQLIGIILVISGVFSIGAVTFGEEKNHRIASVVLAMIRLIAGLLLIVYTKPGMLAVTAVLGAFFFAEGATFLISSLALRHNRAWPLILVNGLVALVLGGLIFKEYPSSATWAVGLLYGINSIFYGVSLVGFAAASKKLS